MYEINQVLSKKYTSASMMGSVLAFLLDVPGSSSLRLRLLSSFGMALLICQHKKQPLVRMKAHKRKMTILLSNFRVVFLIFSFLDCSEAAMSSVNHGLLNLLGFRSTSQS